MRQDRVEVQGRTEVGLRRSCCRHRTLALWNFEGRTDVPVCLHRKLTDTDSRVLMEPKMSHLRYETAIVEERH